MTTVTLGKTGITVNKNGFGALPIQRITKEEAAKLLRKAYDGGITYFDTARAYSDSEEKIGYALSDVRNHIYLATKTAATTAEGFWKDLETSLRLLKTDCIDVYQFHNPAVCPKPGDESGLYDAALKAREQERSGSSASRIIALRLQTRRWIPVCTRRYSSRSAISAARRIWSLWKSAKRQIWALLP